MTFVTCCGAERANITVGEIACGTFTPVTLPVD